MLRLKFGHIEGEHYSGNGYFDHWVDTECILSDFGRRVIKAIDNGEVLSKMCITSPVWDSIPPMLLSGGVKALLTIDNTNKVFRIHAMGNNCFPFFKRNL